MRSDEIELIERVAAEPDALRPLFSGAGIDEIDVVRRLIEILPSAVYAKDCEARFVYANRALLDMVGVASAAELIGRTDHDIHPAHEADIYAELDRQVLTTGEPIHDLVERQTRLDGTIEVVHTTKIAVHDADGHVVGLVGFSSNVTEPARLSEALVISEQRYALAAKASRDGIWDYDVAREEFLLSPRCARLLSVTIRDDPVPRSEIQWRLDPEHTERLTVAIDRVIDDPDQVLEVDLRIVELNGTTRIVSMVGTGVFVDGSCVRIVGAATDTTAERDLERRLRHEASHDDLTGLPNRRGLIERIEATTGHLLYLDVDSFKNVNDSLGHHTGDLMLMELASRFAAAIRPDDLLCRFGGDEFAILMPQADVDAAHTLAERIRDQLEAPIELGGLDLYATVSIGIVGIEAGVDPTTALRDADIALYAAKRAGRARAAVFDPTMLAAAERTLELHMRIRRAVDQDEFSLHYQPIVHAHRRDLVSVEALLRWNTPDGITESPANFLPYLEETGLIVPVGRRVLDSACRQLAAWRSEHRSMRGVGMSVNLSRVQFGDTDLVDHILDSVDAHGLARRDLVVELTETAVGDDIDRIANELARLRGAGVQIAIDDFGVGQSSLSMLSDLPLDILKIDRSFTSRIDVGSDEPVVRSVLSLARALDLATVAEGVETIDHATWLTTNGCDYLQGYLIARPGPPDTIIPAAAPT